MTKCKKRSMMLPEVEIIGCKQLRGAFKAQRFPRPGVELPGDGVELILGEGTQVGTLGQILPQQTIGIFIDATLPGTMRISKVNLHPGRLCQLLMGSHLTSLIVGHGKTGLCFNAVEYMAESTERGFGADIFHLRKNSEQGDVYWSDY